MTIDVATLQPDNDFLVDLGANVWLMDNHKWALYAWERYRQESGIGKFSLVHADYHWDGVYDVFDMPQEEAKLLEADLVQLSAMIKDEDGVQYDSFIAPAVAKGMFDSLHFFCRQNDGSDVGILESIRALNGTEQYIYESADDLVAQVFSSPLIFDLCLDLFNDSEMFASGDIWSDHRILAFLDTVRPLIHNAVLVTVSLSFDYSGTEEDTRHLASIVLPKILAWRSSVTLS